MEITYDYYRIFYYVAKYKSFTKAAEKLGCSQSTVSFQIKQLENSLDIRLFERINHTVKITEQGRQVLEYANSVNRLTQQMEKDLKKLTSRHHFILGQHRRC